MLVFEKEQTEFQVVTIFSFLRGVQPILTTLVPVRSSSLVHMRLAFLSQPDQPPTQERFMERLYRSETLQEY